ncbi:MAG: DUF2207 domain-containing protein [Bradyrhizobiaceae bacterium]|nr:DUF2207 domain-containing protein [Bradyrhizobiaceae bacterium]
MGRVIASEAKQSRAGTRILDRFVAALLAMTPVSSISINRLALAGAVAVLWLGTASAAIAQEVIHRFDSVIHVEKDGTLHVTETVRVRAEGREIKRGIYRDFPLTFVDAGGRRREVTFRLVEVKRDGRPEAYFTRRSGDGVRIYAGREDVFLPRGDYTYTFIYTTGRQLRWFDGGAELYWNVTGNEWSFPISLATVRVVLPGGARLEKFTAYTGPYGARGTNWRGEIGADGALSVETTRRLFPREGFTIVAALPPGAVDPPSATTQIWYGFLDNRGWILGGLGFLLVLGYYGFAWAAVGRDPKGGVIIPLFHPPDGVSPALANYIRNWGFSDQWRAFTAAALSLAVRGLLLFDDKSDTLTLKATGNTPKEGAGSLPPGERAILDWVHRQDGAATIERANATAVAKIGKEFRERIETENRDKFFRRNLAYFFGGVALTALAATGVLFFGGLRESDYAILFFIAFGGIWLGVFLVPLLRGLFRATTTGSLLRAAFVLIVAAAIIGFAGSAIVQNLGGLSGMLPTLLSTLGEYPLPFALVLSFATLNGLFLYLLRAPTDIGRKVMDQIEGLRLYLETAESARLNMNAPEITAERFEALLPYAVALDVEKPWSEAFAAALARAYPGEADPMQHYPARWHTGRSWSGSDFGRAVSSSVASATGAFASAVPASSSGSSGFSGGGGSGGGGGGGGGGGW